ncbi:hypothetical protein L1987_58939 [Smallanthus sonchifolius]|uniref:Uncharacterized protein n=1 Tax=Smallanthus sonchifolius TaxID=185202 RepID=A0ACB9D465_9ASTR|nr:hypothetical protein L1987_58939 [Smallanthus sonchifolius]
MLQLGLQRCGQIGAMKIICILPEMVCALLVVYMLIAVRSVQPAFLQVGLLFFFCNERRAGLRNQGTPIQYSLLFLYSEVVWLDITRKKVKNGNIFYGPNITRMKDIGPQEEWVALIDRRGSRGKSISFYDDYTRLASFLMWVEMKWSSIREHLQWGEDEHSLDKVEAKGADVEERSQGPPWSRGKSPSTQNACKRRRGFQ